MRSSHRIVLTGRRREIERLERMLEAILRDGPRLVLLQGEAGIGKTRLLREVEVLARLRGHLVSYGRAYEDIHLPYLPFEPLLRLVEEWSPGVTPVRLRSLLHGSAEATRDLDGAAAAQERVRLFVEAASATMQLARRAPAVLLLDDLQWFDSSSLALLAHLIFAIADEGEHEPLPLLLVASHRRPDAGAPLASLLARLQREPMCERMELGGLAEEDVAELLEAAGVERASRQLAATIHAATDGNPLFLQSVLQHLRSEGVLEERGGYLTTRVDPRDVKLPDEVSAALLGWIGRAGSACRELLELAAFLGDTFRLDELAALSRIEEGALLGPLEEALELGLVESEAEGHRFRHGLLRRVCYQHTSPDRRRRRHLEISRALRERHDADTRAGVLEIARHLLAAGPLADPEEVVRYGERAAASAAEVYAWGESARLYQAAASAVSESGARGRLYLAAGRAWERSADIGPSLDCFDLAIDGFRRAGDARGAAEALVERTVLESTRQAEVGHTIDLGPLDAALASEESAEPGLRGRILHALATAHWVGGNAGKAAELAAGALEIGREVPDPTLCARASGMLGLAHAQRLELGEALEAFEAALRYAQQLDDPWERLERLVRLGIPLLTVGRLDRAEQVVGESLELARRLDNLRDASVAVGDLALLALVRGDFEAVERHAHDASKLARRSRYPWALLWVLPALASVRHLQGHDEAAQQAIDLLAEPGRVFEEPGPEVESFARGFTRLLAAARGETWPRVPAPRPSAPARSARGVDSGALVLLCTRVEAAVWLREPELARSAYGPLRQAAERGVRLVPGWVFLLPRLLGVTARLIGALDEAEQHLAEALEVGSELGARPELARTHLDCVELLQERGRASDATRAREHVVVAASLFEELGMAPYARRAAELARQFDVALPAPRAAAPGRSWPPSPGDRRPDSRLRRRRPGGRRPMRPA